MRDPYLAAIIDSVADGGDAVSVAAALHSGAIVSGYIRRPQFFASVTRDETRVALETMTGTKPRSPLLPALQLQHERVDAIYGRRIDVDAGSDVITLSDVTMMWSTGDGLKLKTMRLSLTAIAAWWVVKGEAVKAPKDDSGFWAVGVTF